MQDVGCNMLHLKYRSTADITLSSCTSEVSSTNDKDAELYNVKGDRYQNIRFCLSRSVEVNKHKKFQGVSSLEMVKDSFCSVTLRILLLYRSPTHISGSLLDCVYINKHCKKFP